MSKNTPKKGSKRKTRSKINKASSKKAKDVRSFKYVLQFCDKKDFSLSDVQFYDDGAWLSRSSYSDCYTNSWKPNRAIIIDNVAFPGKYETRYRADADAKLMELILEKLRFEVTTFTNKRIPEIKQCLREFASSSQKTTSTTVVYIRSHEGAKDKQPYLIDTNGERMSAAEVCEYFSGTNCLRLNGKPKIFFFQFCRNDVQSDSVEADGPVNMGFLPSSASDGDAPHDMADMLVSFATTAGASAYRNLSKRSWFITALCKVLAEKAETEDLLSMMKMVNKSVMAKRCDSEGKKVEQMTKFKSTFSKKVRFYPHQTTPS